MQRSDAEEGQQKPNRQDQESDAGKMSQGPKPWKLYYFDNLGILRFEHNFFHKINTVIYSDITLLSNPDF